MARRFIAATAIAGFLFGVATTSASALPKKPVCKIITEADIGDIFGAAPTDTIEDGQKGKFSTCTWKVPSASGSEATVFIGINKPNSLNKKDFKDNSKAPTAEKVPGIKKGFIDGITVTFIKGSNFVNVQYLGATPAETDTDGLIALAKEIYGKL